MDIMTPELIAVIFTRMTASIYSNCVQRQGIGRKILQHLCRQSNAKGADGCIVFVQQHERMFFWKCGFRMSGKYRVMKPCG